MTHNKPIFQKICDYDEINSTNMHVHVKEHMTSNWHTSGDICC